MSSVAFVNVILKGHKALSNGYNNKGGYVEILYFLHDCIGYNS